MKLCGSCKITKHNTEFNKSKTGKDGLYYYCKPCAIDIRKAWYKENKTKRLLQTKAYSLLHPEYYKERKAKWYAENKDYFRNHCKKYEKLNPEIRKKIARKYYSSSHGLSKARVQTAKRRAKKLCATPGWLSNDHLKEIERIYRDCPEGHHVDHIVPLQGRNVSGLHVPWNLQYLSAVENLSKGNR